LIDRIKHSPPAQASLQKAVQGKEILPASVNATTEEGERLNCNCVDTLQSGQNVMSEERPIQGTRDEGESTPSAEKSRVDRGV
jgi:hypothetical protein